MAENNLDDRCMKYINGMLAHNGTLKQFSIAGNHFTDNCALILADCLEVWQVISSLQKEKTTLINVPALYTKTGFQDLHIFVYFGGNDILYIARLQYQQ